MIRSIVESSLQLRFLVVIIAAALIIAGIFQLRSMPVDVLPEYAPPLVEVQTEALGLAADEVESLLTVPLEELLSGIPWLQTIRSRSVSGLSSITLVFEPGTDLMHARQVVRERLGLTFFSLPNVTKGPVMLQPLSATSRVMMIGLSSQELSPVELSVLARWNIQPRLMGIPGVANVSIWGQRRRQLQVQVDPERLQTQGVTLDQVIRSTGNSLWFSPLNFLNASYPGSGGWIDTPQQRLGVRHVLPVSAPAELAQVSVDGTSLQLGDLGQVVENHPPLIGDAVLKGDTGLILVVEKFPGANTLEVTRQLDATLAALRLGLPGVEIDSQVFRTATFIETAIANLSRTLLIGALLVVVVLALFLFDWRTALVSIVAIPLSLLVAGLVLYGRGETFNAMVLAGFVIALGAVVDDAVVDIENIKRRLRQPRQERAEYIPGDKSIVAIILEASSEMRGAIIFATLVAVLAVLPVFFIGGLTGAFFRPLALSYVLALIASMVVALTVTPALSMILLSNAPRDRRQSPLVRWLQGGYARLLGRAIRTPVTAYSIVGVLAVAGIAVLPLLGQSLLPSFQEPDLVIKWEGTPGTSHPEMTRLTAKASRELQTIPGVRNVNAHVGRAVLGDEVVGINSAELWVSVDPKADYDATITAIQETVDGYPGLVRSVQTYLEERTQQVLTGANQAVVVRIYGPELDVLRSTGEEVRQALAGIDGIVDLTLEPQVSEPNVEIKVDLARAKQYGLIPGDVRRAAGAMVAGLEVGILFEQQKVFDVVVWSGPETRHSLTSLHKMLIDVPGGGHVRLGDVADLRVASTLNAINREANSRRIDLGFNVRGRDLDSVVAEVESRLQQIDFPLEYHPELLGGFAEQQAAQNRVLGAVIVAVIGIYLLLQAAFGSWRLAFLFLVALLVGLVGGLLAALGSGGVISLGALAGLLAVLAIAARSGILLINHYQHLEEHEGETFGPEHVLRGARERLGPILMTVLATALALVPFVFFGDIAGHEIAFPMAIIILGGLVTSTVINLFVIPTLYLRFGSSPEPLILS
jgi:CzcA family heavy metal efflux pump